MHDLAHCVTAQCEVGAEVALDFLADGIAVGRWALGCFNTLVDSNGVFRGVSLFDGQPLLAKPIADRMRMLVEYHIGTDAAALFPRIIAKVVPGPTIGRRADQCLVSLLAWRDASMREGGGAGERLNRLPPFLAAKPRERGRAGGGRATQIAGGGRARKINTCLPLVGDKQV